LGCLEVAIEHNFQDILRDIGLCIDFEIPEVKVPVIFSGTQGFPVRRDGRYITLAFLMDLYGFW
jgi:hypothetical protein